MFKKVITDYRDSKMNAKYKIVRYYLFWVLIWKYKIVKMSVQG